MLGFWTSGLLLLSEETFDQVRFWFAGSVVGRDVNSFLFVSPFLLTGALVSAGLVVLVTGGAVSVAGPIAFVGLAVPDIVRAIVGPDHRRVLPYSLPGGAIFLTGADIVGRLVLSIGEIPAGIVTGLIGAPFLVYLAR